LNSLTNTV